VAGRLHAVRDVGQAGAQAVEVDKRAQEGRDLDIRLAAEDRDEALERRDVRVRLAVDLALDRRRRRRRRAAGCWCGVALDDVDGALGDVGCEEEGAGERFSSRSGREDARVERAGEDDALIMAGVTGCRTSSSRRGSCMNLGRRDAGCRRVWERAEVSMVESWRIDEMSRSGGACEGRACVCGSR